MDVFYIDFEHAERYVSDLQIASGIDEKNMVFAPKNVCFPPYFPALMVFKGKWKILKSRVQGWSASKVRWSTSSVYLFLDLAFLIGTSVHRGLAPTIYGGQFLYLHLFSFNILVNHDPNAIFWVTF